MTEQTNDRTDAAIAMVARGASIDECLARYPEDTADLRPLLEAAIAYQHGQAEDLQLAARSRLRGRVMAEWDYKSAGPVPSRWSWLRLPTLPGIAAPRWAAAALSVAALTLFSGTGTVLASANSVPGDQLYPVKEVREAATVWLTLTPEAKVAVYADLVRERTEEIRQLASASRADRTPTAAARLEQHVKAIETIVRGDLAPSDVGGESLADAIAAEREASTAIQHVIAQAPVSARPGLEEALVELQRARSRVDDALEGLKSRLDSPQAPDKAF